MSTANSLLFISTNDHVQWGGSEVLWSRVALACVQRGHHVVASVKKWTPRHAALLSLALAGVELHERARPVIPKSRLDRARSRLSRGRTLVGSLALRVRPFRTIISLGNHVDGAFQPIAQDLRRFGFTYDVVVQLVHPFCNLSDEQADRLIEAYEGARLVIFMSEQNRQIASLQFGHGFRNALVLGNPPNIEPLPGPLPYPPTNGGLRVAMVGSLVPFHKGQDIALEVFEQGKWKSRPLELHIFGAGPSRRIIERNIARMELRNVSVHGFESDRRLIWASRHAALFPSRMEGQSLAFLEAMACGRMVIATRVGDADKRIVDGVNGFLVRHLDADALDQALERAWSHVDMWEAMCLAAYETHRSFGQLDFVRHLADLACSPT